ncbi:MAG: ParA family protein [Bacteroidales bacterium]
MRIICISNHKGGVGKTTASRNIAGALARKFANKKVLLIDADPQENLSMALKTSPEAEAEMAVNNVYQSITGRHEIHPMPLSDNIDLIPASLDMTAGEFELAGVPGREYFFKDMLAPFQDEYAYCVIDTPPSLGLFTQNALAIAHHIIVPVGADLYSLKGLNTLMNAVARMKKYINKDLSIGGIFFNRVSPTTQMFQVSLEWMKEYYPEYLMDTFIRANTDLTKATTEGSDIFEYNEKCNGAIDYEALVNEYLEKNK